MTPRTCGCDHSYPVCACFEGHSGPELLRRSQFLSSLAGWPAPDLSDETISKVIVRYGRPASPPPLLGDRVEELAHRIGVDRMAAWIEARTGQPCGCAERKEALNRLDSWLRG